MRHTHLLPLLCMGLLALAAPQDSPPAPAPDAQAPKKPELPELPAPSVPAEGTPSTEPSPEDPRTDLVQRFPQRSPFLGVWRITKAVRSRPNSSSVTTGYVVFTPAYFSLHVFQQGEFDGRKAFQTAMRTWRIEDGLLVTSSLVGVRSAAAADKILLEARGYTERRRFLFLGPKLLRIYQEGPNFLELIKVEDPR